MKTLMRSAIGMAVLATVILCADSKASERSISYDEDLARKQLLLESIMEESLPSTVRTVVGLVPMYGAVTPEKNHEIIKEDKG